MKVKNIWLHFKKICIHKYWVFRGCCNMRIPWRGIVHDLSKFSPIEFWESAKYYQGTRSPIEAAKEDKGYCAAWLHHKSHNKHHWQYWIDSSKGNLTPQLMPLKYAKEMYCDIIAANHAYTGKHFSYEGVKKWWDNEVELNGKFIHPVISTFITCIISKAEAFNRYPKNVDNIYNYLCYCYKNNIDEFDWFDAITFGKE